MGERGRIRLIILIYYTYNNRPCGRLASNDDDGDNVDDDKF